MSEQAAVAEQPQTETPELDDAAMLAALEAEESGEALEAEQPEAEPQEAKADEPSEPQPAAKDDEKYDNVKKALQQARFEARELKRQMAELQQRNQPQQYEQPQQPQMADEDWVDFDQNPEQAVRQAIEFAKQQRQMLAEQQRQAAEEAAYNQQMQYVANVVREAEAEFREQAADYGDAVNYLRNNRIEELQVYGYTADQAQQAYRDEAIDLAAYAVQNQIHPAQMIYELARKRGFSGAQPQAAPQQPAQPQAAQARLDAMKQAAQAPKAPKGGTGGNRTGVVTDEMLMNASGSEFDKLWAQFEKQNAQ